MNWDSKSAITNIGNEAKKLIKRAKDLEYGDDKAFLRDVLYKLKESFISIASLGNPSMDESSEGDVDPDLIALLIDEVSRLNSVMDRANSLVSRVVSDKAKVLMEAIKIWITKTLLAIMPHVTRSLKLQSWSFGMSATSFGIIAFTFGT